MDSLKAEVYVGLFLDSYDPGDTGSFHGRIRETLERQNNVAWSPPIELWGIHCDRNVEPTKECKTLG